MNTGSMDSKNESESFKFEADSNLINSERLDFQFERVQLQFDLKNDMTKLHVENNIMYILTSSLVYRIDLENPSDVVRVTAPAIADKVKITRSWVHPNGKFLIAQVNKTHYYVLHMSYRKFKVLPRFKGLSICSVAFGNTSDDQTTGDFLAITVDGTVYVSLIKHHDPVSQENKRDDKYTKQLFHAKATAFAICYSQKLRQIQLFLESQMLVWDCVDLVLDEITRSFRQHPIKTDIPDGSQSALILALPESYYYFTPLTSEFACNDEETIAASEGKLNTETSLSRNEDSLFMTPHHFVNLNEDHTELLVIDKLMSQDPLSKKNPRTLPGESVLGLAVDYSAGTHWLYTSNSIHEILFTNEAASVWYSYYKMGNFEKALEVLNSATETPKTWFKKNVVMIKQGYDLLQKGGFGIEIENVKDERERFELQKQGIRKLGRLQEQFEKVCLLLMNVNEQNTNTVILSNKLLLEYLTVKFAEAKEHKNKIQQIALSSWIVKLYLNIVYVIQNDFLKDSEILPELSENDVKEFWKKDLAEIEESFSSFLSSNSKTLDQKTIYQLMTNMQAFQKLISFAELQEDYEYVVDYYIDEEDWPAALRAIAKLYVKDQQKGQSAVFKTAEVLLWKFPKQTVETWLRLPELDYERLLPAVLSYNKVIGHVSFSQNFSIQFLQRLIFEKSVKNQNINNYYLSLVISYKNEDEETVIEKTLTKALEFFQSSDLGYRKGLAYDKDLILRLSLRFKRYKSAVLILINDMNLHEVALKLALEHRLTSLGEFVLKSYDDYTVEDMDSEGNVYIIESTETEESKVIGKIKLEDDTFAARRKLWLVYAKYLVERVCAGETLDIVGLQAEPKQEMTKGSNGETSVQSISKELLELTINEELPELQSSRLNRALQYLLRLSYSKDRNSNVLTLKDLLPLFPESIKIIHFREEIVESLNLYNTKINQLGLEMQESASTAQKLKTQIQEQQAKQVKGSIYTIIEPGEACQLCGKLLVEKNFILFPNCHHGFHKDCTIRFYLQLKGDYRFKKMFQSFKQTSSLADKAELDRLLQSECLLCNDSLINKIEDPLIDLEKERLEWDL